MGYNITGILINSLPQIAENDSFDIMKLKTKYVKTKVKSLSPKDLSISFKNGNTLILLDMVFYKNISEERELTKMEEDLNKLFPNSKILIFSINDIVNFVGYSLIENGVKIRTKAVANGNLFLDYGDIIGIEPIIYEKSKKIVSELSGDSKNEKELKETIEQALLDKTEIGKKKFYISIFNNLIGKNNRKDMYEYYDGGLDNFMIEKMFNNIIKCDYSEIEAFDFIEFERRKLNFQKDSFKEFLFVAFNELRPFSEN